LSGAGYEILALLMRYVFILLGALIVARAFLWLRRDHLAFQKELRERPEIGRIGELVDEAGGKSWPVYQEGVIGSAGSCDIQVKKRGLKRKHAVYRLQEGKGLLVTPVRRARVTVDGVRPRKEALALSGSVLRLGEAELRLRLNPETGIPERTEIIPPADDQDESWMRLFEDGADPDADDPLNPAYPGGVPGWPDAGAFLPDGTEERKKE
jgi:hypothetical protein